ncbi:MAG TPA: glycosyltransferase [Candidatus Limnocylindrales bacterium]
MTTKTRIAISCALQNTGQATRSLELAKGIQEGTPAGHEAAITFLSHGSWFEPYIREAGFDIIRVQPEVEGRCTDEDMKFDPPELIGSVDWASAFIAGQRQAIREIQPDLVIHGFWQVGNIAARMEGIPTIAFLPVPPSLVVESLHRSRLGLVTQHNLTQAIIDAGWEGEPPTTIYDQCAADLTIINDIPNFYTGSALPPDVAITGPLFTNGTYGTAMDRRLLSILTSDDGRPKILLTMGSSGTKQAMLEAARAIATAASHNWNAIILASPAICRIDEIQQIVADNPAIFVTDRFIPALPIAELVDCVVTHGGQATIQTALAGGTPIVGVAMQMEQQINLEHIANAGAGIRIASDQWRAATIQEAIRTIIGDPSYQLRAQEIAHAIHTGSGRRHAAETIWGYIERGLTIQTASDSGISGEFPL